MICDGLRADMIRPDWTPNLCRLASESRVFSQHRSVYPSTTRTTAASIATGCHPGRHGLQGNCVALDEGQGLVAVSVGPEGFRERLKKATGRTLHVPTISERLVKHGGAIIYSNVSPGAAYFHDPDGHGYIYHRSGSFAPGLHKVVGQDHLDVSHDVAGDEVMTRRFCHDVLVQRQPAYGLIWLCEPDHTQHVRPLGSADQLAVMAAADANVSRVMDAVKAQQDAGQDILLVVASDHGHETVERSLPLTDMLIDAGLKESTTSSDVVIASNGLSAHLYFSEDARSRIADVRDFLTGIEDIARVFTGDDLKSLGHRTDTALAISIVTRRTDRTNPHGIAGMSIAIADPLSADTYEGCGQHGGLGPYEQSPFLMIKGFGFSPGSVCQVESSAVDLAPTSLYHLGIAADGMDGRKLQTI